MPFGLWACQAEAQQAAALPLHSAAARLVTEMYVSYRLERYRLRKAPGSGQVTVESCSMTAP